MVVLLWFCHGFIMVLWWIGDGLLDASGSSHSVYLTSRHWTVGIRFEPGNAPCIPIPHLCGHIRHWCFILPPGPRSLARLHIFI